MVNANCRFIDRRLPSQRRPPICQHVECDALFYCVKRSSDLESTYPRLQLRLGALPTDTPKHCQVPTACACTAGQLKLCESIRPVHQYHLTDTSHLDKIDTESGPKREWRWISIHVDNSEGLKAGTPHTRPPQADVPKFSHEWPLAGERGHQFRAR